MALLGGKESPDFAAQVALGLVGIAVSTVFKPYVAALIDDEQERQSLSSIDLDGRRSVPWRNQRRMQTRARIRKKNSPANEAPPFALECASYC
jgi:hypothetical protein